METSDFLSGLNLNNEDKLLIETFSQFLDKKNKQIKDLTAELTEKQSQISKLQAVTVSLDHYKEKCESLESEIQSHKESAAANQLLCQLPASIVAQLQQSSLDPLVSGYGSGREDDTDTEHLASYAHTARCDLETGGYIGDTQDKSTVSDNIPIMASCGVGPRGATSSSGKLTLHGFDCHECPQCSQTFLVQVGDGEVAPGTDTIVITSPTEGRPRGKKTSPSYQCTLCGQTFTRKNDLRRHEMAIHRNDKPFKCDKCDMAFVKSNDLKMHHLTHDNFKPFECSLCPKRFLRAASLRYHERTHLLEKPHVCNVCNTGLASPAALRTHMMLHTGRKDHLCSHCGLRFRQKQHLLSHMKLKHRVTVETARNQARTTL